MLLCVADIVLCLEPTGRLLLSGGGRSGRSVEVTTITLDEAVAIYQEFLRNLLQDHVSGSQHQFEVVQNVSVLEDQLVVGCCDSD